jgi:hypothetical protein
MGTPLFTNNAATGLVAPITNSATTLTVNGGSGSLFPSPTGGNYFMITLISASTGNMEIVQCTARSGDTFTIVRAQEGTTALAFAIGDAVQLRITAGSLASFANGVTSVVAGSGIGVSSATGAVTVSNTGVLNINAGSGINVSSSTGSVTISNTAVSPIPSGTTMLFYQSAAPTGWTQVTSINDYALRIVSGTGGTTGGSTAFSTVFANQTPTITVSGLSASATTLSTGQMPSHSHTGTLAPAWYSCTPVGSNPGFGQTGSYSSFSTNAQGGGGSHTHSISGSATSSAIALNVQYANVIICSKN